MDYDYPEVITRFLNDNERLILSDEKEMPLVLEARESKDLPFLKQFLNTNSAQIMKDIATYGAVLLRGFDIQSDEDFEKVVMSIQGMKGISEAFMSEEGRIHVGKLKYVLHTNAVYKTGGTLYLGGFHSENYYSADVPAFISFCCLKPSIRGGETGLVNMEKIYPHLDEKLKEKLEKHSFYVSKWLLTEVVERYDISVDTAEKICQHFDLPIVGKGNDRFVLMYKPSIFEHPATKKKSLQINLFEILSLNPELRKCFLNDYKGSDFFWHRFVWRMPEPVFKIIEKIYVACASFFYSPKDSLKILLNKILSKKAASKKDNLPSFNQIKVGSLFNKKDVKDLAKLIRAYYSSSLWQKGDILIVDNRKVMHAGMPGAGDRLIRAMISNPIDMKYSYREPGTIDCSNRLGESIGFYLSQGQLPKIVKKELLVEE